MKTLSLCGAFDLHIHAAPDCFDRIGNDIEIAQQAKAAGMRAIAIKSVYESTVSRAWHTMQSVEGLTVYGGVTMDHHVGGVNPAAVDPCLKMGGENRMDAHLPCRGTPQSIWLYRRIFLCWSVQQGYAAHPPSKL